jgi:hypothetical protein
LQEKYLLKAGGWTMRQLGFLILTCLAVGLGACSEEQPEFTDQQRMCIAQRYNNYDPKQLNQCLDVCKNCMKGSVVTCNTSCKLRGAS